MKSTPTAAAASSIARASSSSFPLAPSVSSETGVIAIRLLATRIPNSSPISSRVFTRRAATRRIFSPAFCAMLGMESLLQSSKLSPSVTVRTSRCSISVMATVCRISAWVYSIRLADHLAENEQHEEYYEQHTRNENEAQAGIVGRLIDHDARNVTNLFDSFADVVSQPRRLCSGRYRWRRTFRNIINNLIVTELMTTLWTKQRGLAERDSAVRTTSGEFRFRHRRTEVKTTARLLLRILTLDASR